MLGEDNQKNHRYFSIKRLNTFIFTICQNDHDIVSEQQWIAKKTIGEYVCMASRILD